MRIFARRAGVPLQRVQGFLCTIGFEYLPTQYVQKLCMARFARTEFRSHAQPAATRIPEAKHHPKNVVFVIEKVSFYVFSGHLKGGVREIIFLVPIY